MAKPSLHFPFGKLVSFGSGADILTFPNSSSPVRDVSLDIDDNFVTLPALPFPVDMQGVGSTPWKETEASWEYLLQATYGQDNATAYATVEDQFAAIYSFLRGDNADGTGGTYGLLTVQDARGNSTSCTARCKSLKLSLRAGRNTRYYIVPLTFVLLSEWH